MSQVANTMMVPHAWGAVWALPLPCNSWPHCPASLSLNPVEPFLEYDQSSHPFRKDLVFDSIRMEAGKIWISTRPGIGVDVNRDVLDEYRVAP